MAQDLSYATCTSSYAFDASKLGCLVPLPADAAEAAPSALPPDPLVRPELPCFQWDTNAFPWWFSAVLLTLRRLRADPDKSLGAPSGPGDAPRRRTDCDEDDAWTCSGTSSAKGCISRLSLEWKCSKHDTPSPHSPARTCVQRLTLHEEHEYAVLHPLRPADDAECDPA